MPYNGSGTFAVYTPGTPYVTGTVISSTVANNVNSDFATGLSTALTKDGQTTATALIPFAQGLSAATGTLQYPASTVVGRWTTPAFAAGDFTANGSMTWTVAAGDVTTFAYTIVDKVMTVSFFIVTSTVGGTPSNTLQITIPAAKTATKSMRTKCFVIDNGSADEAGTCSVAASGTLINILRAASAVWSTATDTTQVAGEITFEIN